MKILTPQLSPARLKAGLTAVSDPDFKLTFATLLILAALGVTYVGSDGNFPGIELRDVLVRGMAVSFVLLLGALAISLRSRTASNAALALVTLAGLITAYVVHTELFYTGNRFWMFAVCAAEGVALFVAFRLIDDYRWGGLSLSVAASLPLFALIWSRVWPMLTSGIVTPGGLLYVGNPVMWVGLIALCAGSAIALLAMTRVVEAARWGGVTLLVVTSFVVFTLVWLDRNHGESGGGYYADGWEDHPNMQSITFDETPNLYFVGFDSITPKAIMQKHMGIETTDFHRIMEEELRRFPNLFANSVSTKSFYRTFMSLDLEFVLDHREATGSSPDYFAGHDLSPLIWIMRENGFRTTSIFDNTFFGYLQGPGIDDYIINRKNTVCPLLDHGIRRWAFWGYCRNRGGETDLPKGEFLVREVTGVERSSPQFVIAHLYLPGHAPKIFNYDSVSDRESFMARFEKNLDRAAVYLEKIIDHLRFNDPNAILFVYGDHGAWLSRGMEIEDDPEFFLQDRFGILGGVYPPDRCAAEFDEAESKGYVTSLDIVHAILECLSGGQSPLREPRSDRFWGGGVPEDHSYKYEDFLYE